MRFIFGTAVAIMLTALMLLAFQGNIFCIILLILFFMLPIFVDDIGKDTFYLTFMAIILAISFYFGGVWLWIAVYVLMILFG